MRIVWVLAIFASCNGMCGHDPPAPIHKDLATTPSSSASSALTFAVEDAQVVVDGGCISAHDDALARYKIFCTTETCHDDSIGPGTKVADLDGDGIPEIAWGWGPIPVNNESHLYRGGTPCAIHLASLGGSMMIKPQKTRHEGYLDIVTEDYGICEGASGGCTPDIDSYIFHDGEYRIDPKHHIAGTFKLGRPPEED